MNQPHEQNLLKLSSKLTYKIREAEGDGLPATPLADADTNKNGVTILLKIELNGESAPSGTQVACDPSIPN